MNNDVMAIKHACVKITGTRIIYTDPFKLDHDPHDADYVLITHPHFDHYSPDDIAKIRNKQTVIIAPAGSVSDASLELKPGESFSDGEVIITAIPAYDIKKDIHKKEFGWIGYLIEMQQERIYVTGDTELTPEMMSVSADVLCVPVDGTFTMDADEAAKVAEIVKPQVLIPIHYGTIDYDINEIERLGDMLDREVTYLPSL